MPADGGFPPDMTPEVPQTPEYQLQQWGKEVKKALAENRAKGTVTARTNFDITSDALGIQTVGLRADRNEGYKNGLFIRGNISEKEGEQIYNAMGSINSPEEEFPRNIKPDTLYVSIIKPENIEPQRKQIKSLSNVMQHAIGENKSIIEVRYAQPKADASHRTAEKWIHLVVPDQQAAQFQIILEEGVSPSDIHETVADIFTTPDTRPYFDANIVNWNDPTKIEIKATEPTFQETFYSNGTAPGKPIERKIVHHDPDATWTEKAGVELITSTPHEPAENMTSVFSDEPLVDPEATPPHGMPPIEPPQPPVQESTPEPEPSKFEKSFVITNESELSSIKNDSLRRRVKHLHEAAKAGLFNRQEWTDEYRALMRDSNDERFEDDWGSLDLVLANMNQGIHNMDEKKIITETPSSTRKVEGPLDVRVIDENLPRPESETPEGWAKLVLQQVTFAEKLSEERLSRSTTGNNEDESSVSAWTLIDTTLARIPNNLGNIDRGSELAEFRRSKNPEGLTFKERLRMYVDARRHINDRFIEISRADGSLTAMGLGKDEVPFEGISYKLQRINDEDWWMMFHPEEVLPELPHRERKELSPDVSEASETWLEIGIANRTLPLDLLDPEERAVIDRIFDNAALFNTFYSEKDKEKLKKRKLNIQKFWPSAQDFYTVFNGNIPETELFNSLEIFMSIPTFDNSRNVVELVGNLRRRIIENRSISTKGEDLAYRIQTVWLTQSLFDRNRSSSQGNSEDRDLFWSERKRIKEFAIQEREPGLDWTIGRYFVADPDQAANIKNEDAERSPKLAHRKRTLQISAERNVFIEKDGYFQGEVVGDFLQQSQFFVNDRLNPGNNIARNIASYIVNADGTVRRGGFKEVPFLRMGERSYSGYFGYTLGKAKQINADLTGLSWKDPNEMASDDWWARKRDLIGRLDHISPRFIIKEFEFRGEIIRKILRKDGRFDQDEISKILGYSNQNDLSVITDPNLRREAERMIVQSPTDPRKPRTVVITEGYGREEKPVIDPKTKQPLEKTVAEAAKYYADKYKAEQIAKIRMIHALGQVWTGSLDSLEEISQGVTSSTISPSLITGIVRAIESSRYLEGEYLNHFIYEVFEEMGFGTRWSAGRKKERPHNKINPDKWK